MRERECLVCESPSSSFGEERELVLVLERERVSSSFGERERVSSSFGERERVLLL